MKHTIFVLTLIFSLKFCLFSQQPEFITGKKMENDTTAYSIISKNLAVVKKYVESERDSIFLDFGNVIGFFINLTGIPPESFFENSINPVHATKSDYKRWETWIVLNRNNIYWDENEKLILIKKTVQPYSPLNR